MSILNETPVARLRANVRKVYRRAESIDHTEGRAWYKEAQSIAREIGQGDTRKGAGIIAALSPMVRWDKNIEYAREGVQSHVFTGNFRKNNDKARRIFEGDAPESVLGGDKVRAFYENILTGGESETPVVDRHALAIALGRPLNDRERKITRAQYKRVAQVYRDVAREFKLAPSVLQAITWVAWRREKGEGDNDN